MDICDISKSREPRLNPQNHDYTVIDKSLLDSAGLHTEINSIQYKMARPEQDENKRRNMYSELEDQLTHKTNIRIGYIQHRH